MFMHDLHALPREVLEQIALYAVACESGPPVGLVPILLVSRTVHDRLLGSGLFARLLALLFDMSALARRLGAALERSIAADELVRRFRALQNMRRGVWNTDDLWRMYLLALEDDGKNGRHLEWADVAGALERAASMGYVTEDTPATSLALNIRAMLATSDKGTALMAFGAHAYNILYAPDVPVQSHSAHAQLKKMSVHYCGQELEAAVPPAAIGAILLFCSAHSTKYAPAFQRVRASALYDADFMRLMACSSPSSPGLPSGTFIGIMDGMWEGPFFFLEFDAYRDMTSGHAFVSNYAGQRQLLRLSEECTTDSAVKLRGSGHSAWGRFTVDGHLRTWDGLVTLHKRYYSRREAWIYRGYVFGRDRIVGRWRDMSEGSLVLYEGPFVLSRRS